MTLKERVVDELVKRIMDNNFERISISMKCNGDVIYITPCSMVPEITSFDDIEYFLIDCSLPWAGNDKIEKVADFIIDYQNRVDENEQEKIRLKEYYKKYHNTSKMDWSWYSDWHKDVYGYRPRHEEH